MTIPADGRSRTRDDLAWAIAVGGIGIVLFAALLVFTWYFAATLLLIFTGMLLGVGLNALTNALGRHVGLPHPFRLAIVCIVLAAMLAGIAYLGGATIAEQASALSNTIKSQLVTVKAFLESHGIDTSFFDIGNASSANATPSGSETAPSASPPHAGLPGAGALASSGGAIVSQTLKLLLGTISAVGNFFIVLFLGFAFAAQPGVYHDGLLFIAPARHRSRATVIIDGISETLERWLIAQIIVMLAVGVVTWIGLAIIGIPGSFILGIQAGLLAFIPTVGAIIAGVIVVLASIASGWVAALSALILFLGVHAMESYVLTPILQRQALDIPPATLFAFQILLGVVFGIWGLALALPLVAIAKVLLDHFKSYEAPAAAA
ncbi:AI-2E family transporter [Bradyrhizobium sp. CCGUVB1N3]|uniref:AI-2E family transporter n=1 Tax=Bradyrhizobium sp. CCGUVB1N3 TaxID=2949629 RepID=UPI0020B2EA98|nr:AI-2E family transporter [Bradyrhizobium sp. CCGUVB1N3]MCP3470338.1 AI-2E family transporter [Bradyrhizobium sp. CCGUVB1N3]